MTRVWLPERLINRVWKSLCAGTYARAGWHGFDRASAHQFAVVVGGHHGVPPEDGQLTGLRGRSEFVGAGIWKDTRRAILSRAAGRMLACRSCCPALCGGC
jgi:hypothetical protein